MSTSRPFYTRDDIAGMLGIAPASVTMKVRRAKEHLAEYGRPQAGDIPLPDGHVGSGPGVHWWRVERIDEWVAELAAAEGKLCSERVASGRRGCTVAASALVGGRWMCSLHANLYADAAAAEMAEAGS